MSSTSGGGQGAPFFGAARLRIRAILGGLVLCIVLAAVLGFAADAGLVLLAAAALVTGVGLSSLLPELPSRQPSGTQDRPARTHAEADSPVGLTVVPRQRGPG